MSCFSFSISHFNIKSQRNIFLTVIGRVLNGPKILSPVIQSPHHEWDRHLWICWGSSPTVLLHYIAEFFRWMKFLIIWYWPKPKKRYRGPVCLISWAMVWWGLRTRLSCCHLVKRAMCHGMADGLQKLKMTPVHSQQESRKLHLIIARNWILPITNEPVKGPQTLNTLAPSDTLIGWWEPEWRTQRKHAQTLDPWQLWNNTCVPFQVTVCEHLLHSNEKQIHY
jgi:hypothetical protein